VGPAARGGRAAGGAAAVTDPEAARDPRKRLRKRLRKRPRNRPRWGTGRVAQARPSAADGEGAGGGAAERETGPAAGKREVGGEDGKSPRLGEHAPAAGAAADRSGGL